MEEKIAAAKKYLRFDIALVCIAVALTIYHIVHGQIINGVGTAFFLLGGLLGAFNVMMGIRYLRAGRQMEERERERECISILVTITALIGTVAVLVGHVESGGDGGGGGILIGMLILALIDKIKRLRSNGEASNDDQPHDSPDPTAQP